MIPATDSNSITVVKIKSLESIVEWFEEHLQSFYSIGCSYVGNQQQLEELFYQSIKKVHKEIFRYKSETSFETWVTTIFIRICKELAKDTNLQVSEENETRPWIFNALDHLQEDEKDALVLTYIKGFAYEETAHISQISTTNLKGLLMSSIQTLRKVEKGSTFSGCDEYQQIYMDYLDGTLDRQRKVDLEVHVYHCQNCQEDLGTLQDTILNFTHQGRVVYLPDGFMEKVKSRIADEDKQRKLKFEKRKRTSLTILGVFTLLIGIGFFTGTFAKIYYSWTEENQELRYYFQEDLAERLNLEAENNGIKITIKSAIADEFQTVIYYEIEDTNGEYQYMMNYEDGVIVENEYEIMSNKSYPRYYLPDLKSEINNEKKNVYQGKMSLLPLNLDAETIKLRITRLQKLIRDENSPYGFALDYERENYVTGEWNFEIPVTTKPTAEFALNEEIEIEGVPVRFDKLITSPTTTILQYSVNYVQSETKQINVINIDDLEVNNKKVKADYYGSFYLDNQQDMNWTSYQMNFDPILEEHPKEIHIPLQSVYLSVNDQKMIELDVEQPFPQSFEYAGSTLTIEELEVGETTRMVISDHELKDRAYDTLHYNIYGDENQSFIYTDMNSEGVVVDKKGKVYDVENFVSYEEIDDPRYIQTVHHITLQAENPSERAIPKWIEIYGYATTVYLDEVVKINLEK